MIYLFDVICSSVVCWHPPAVLCPSPRDGESQPGICGMVVRILIFCSFKNLLFKGFYSQIPVSTACLNLLLLTAGSAYVRNISYFVVN